MRSLWTGRAARAPLALSKRDFFFAAAAVFVGVDQAKAAVAIHTGVVGRVLRLGRGGQRERGDGREHESGDAHGGHHRLGIAEGIQVGIIGVTRRRAGSSGTQ